MKFSTSAANAAISSVSMARAGACGGNPRGSPKRGFVQIVQDQGAFAGAGVEKHVVDFGGVLWLHRQLRRHPQLRLLGGLTGVVADGGCRDLSERAARRVGTGRLQPEFFQRLRRGVRRIDRKPRPNGRARCVVDLVDQAGSQLDELPLFVGAMCIGLNIQVGQDAQQSGSDIDALSARERHQSVEARK